MHPPSSSLGLDTRLPLTRPLTGLPHHVQHLRPRQGGGIRPIPVQQIPQYLVTHFVLTELGRRPLPVVGKDAPLAVADASVDPPPIFRRIGHGQISRRGMNHRIISKGSGEGFQVENLLEVRQHGDEVVPVRIPRRVGRAEVQHAAFRIDVRIVNTRFEGDDGPRIDVVVLRRQSQLELEDAVGVRPTADEDDAVELPEIVERWEEVDASRGVILQMLVFDGHLVIAQGLFSLGLRGDGGKEGRPRRSVCCGCAGAGAG